jgi:hypothetical protein
MAMTALLRTPLMPTHLNPTSRMNSATATLSLSGFTQVVYWKRASIDSGEFIVIVVAVRMASHGQRPRPLATASRSALMNISRIPAGAGVGSGRELGASMSDLSAMDSLIVSWEMMRLEKISYEQREPARSEYRIENGGACVAQKTRPWVLLLNPPRVSISILRRVSVVGWGVGQPLVTGSGTLPSAFR